MKKRCTPQVVLKAHQKAQSWRMAAQELNQIYDVQLPHLTWRDYAFGRRDIADPEARTRLMLGPRVCSACGSKPSVYFLQLIRRLKTKDLQIWQNLRKQKKYRAAKKFLEEVYNRQIIKRVPIRRRDRFNK